MPSASAPARTLVAMVWRGSTAPIASAIPTVAAPSPAARRTRRRNRSRATGRGRSRQDRGRDGPQRHVEQHAALEDRPEHEVDRLVDARVGRLDRRQDALHGFEAVARVGALRGGRRISAVPYHHRAAEQRRGRQRPPGPERPERRAREPALRAAASAGYAPAIVARPSSGASAGSDHNVPVAPQQERDRSEPRSRRAARRPGTRPSVATVATAVASHPSRGSSATATTATSAPTTGCSAQASATAHSPPAAAAARPRAAPAGARSRHVERQRDRAALVGHVRQRVRERVGQVRQRAALGGLRPHGAVDPRAQRRREILALALERREHGAHAPGRRGRRPRADRVHARKRLVERDPEAVEVAAVVDPLALGLLGRHVGERAHDIAGARERLVPGEVRDAEVRELGHAGGSAGRIGDQHVLGLDVAVHDAALVRVLERAAQREPDGPARRGRSAGRRRLDRRPCGRRSARTPGSAPARPGPRRRWRRSPDGRAGRRRAPHAGRASDRRCRRTGSP